MYTNSYDSFLNVRNGFPVFSTALEANYVRKHEDAYAAFKLTDDDKQEIHRLARDPRIGARPALTLYSNHCISGPGGVRLPVAACLSVWPLLWLYRDPLMEAVGVTRLCLAGRRSAYIQLWLV